jgi:hypothetical protein
MDRFSWTFYILMLLSIPAAAIFDKWNMHPERFKRRAARWMRNLEANPWHVPLDANEDMTKWPSLILVGILVWVLMFMLAMGQWLGPSDEGNKQKGKSVPSKQIIQPNEQ